MSWHSFLDLAWLILLLFMLVYFWRDRHLLQQTKYWLITKGRITSFEWAQEGARIWPRISYVYHVFDQEFQSEYLFLDTSHNSPQSKYARGVAYRAAVAYQNDEEIDVFYNPNNPHQAALDITMPLKLNIIIILLIALIVLHLCFIIGRLW